MNNQDFETWYETVARWETRLNPVPWRYLWTKGPEATIDHREEQLVEWDGPVPWESRHLTSRGWKEYAESCKAYSEYTNRVEQLIGLEFQKPIEVAVASNLPHILQRAGLINQPVTLKIQSKTIATEQRHRSVIFEIPRLLEDPVLITTSTTTNHQLLIIMDAVREIKDTAPAPLACSLLNLKQDNHYQISIVELNQALHYDTRLIRRYVNQPHTRIVHANPKRIELLFRYLNIQPPDIPPDAPRLPRSEDEALLNKLLKFPVSARTQNLLEPEKMKLPTEFSGYRTVTL